jgi:hypothetical protein
MSFESLRRRRQQVLLQGIAETVSLVLPPISIPGDLMVLIYQVSGKCQHAGTAAPVRSLSAPSRRSVDVISINGLEI